MKELISLSDSKTSKIYAINSYNIPRTFFLKRTIDFSLSLIAIIALLPALILVAALIKLTSKGPIFFKQTRVGKDNKNFSMIKFRSMKVGAENELDKLFHLNEQSGPVFKMKNDPRVTRIGSFIRKHSIDELPQLFNILLGDMSIVGPRPALPKEVAKYKPWYIERLNVLPGLTCHWQCSNRKNIQFDEWMQMDIDYIRNWNLLLDFKLILKTIPVIFTGHGNS